MTSKKDSALLKITGEYLEFEDFLKDAFFKKPELSKISMDFLISVYSTYTGIPANQWPRQITQFFGVFQPRIEELEYVQALYRQRFNKEPKLKPYKELLKIKDQLQGQDIELIEKVANWNSCVSSYYSMLNKLKALGLIERKKGSYVKSNKFKKIFSGVVDLFDKTLAQQSRLYETK